MPHRAPAPCIATVAALVLLAAGCASMNVAEAEVGLTSRLDGDCFEAALRAEKDVIGFRPMPQGTRPGWWFQLADPELYFQGMPTVVASQTDVQGSPIVQLQASFQTDYSNASELREAVVARQQRILHRVVAACANAGVQFGFPRPCGQGEKHSICVRGHLPQD